MFPFRHPVRRRPRPVAGPLVLKPPVRAVDLNLGEDLEEAVMLRSGGWLLPAAGILAMAWGMASTPRPADGRQPAGQLPEGPGLAAKYPGDVGIEKDPAVVFAENFEHASLDGLTKRWESVSQPELLSLADDRPPASGGRSSLLVRHVGGQGTGGHLYRRLQPGHDK